MRYTLFLVAFVLTIDSISAQTPPWGWKFTEGSVGDDRIYASCSDLNGNTYITGVYGADYLFGTDSIFNNHSYDAFIAKYDSNGVYQWVRTASGSDFDYGSGICTDSLGNVYATGYYESDTLLFDDTLLINLNVLINHFEDVYMVKYDPSGVFQWAKSFPATAGAVSKSIYTDSKNIYLAGYFASDSMNIDTITIHNPNSASTGVFVSKFSMDGNPIWGRTNTAGSSAFCNSVTADKDGNVILTGFFDGGITFLPFSISGHCIISGCVDYFTVKLDSMGNPLWLSGAGGTGNGNVSGNAVTTDNSGNVYVTGHFDGGGMIMFGTDTLRNLSGSTYLEDAFIVKYNSSGIVKWARSVATDQGDLGLAIKEQNGKIFFTGEASGYYLIYQTDTFPGSFFGGFVMCVDSFGDLHWVKSVYGNCRGLGLTNDDVIVSGELHFQIIVFDTDTFYNSGPGKDIFLAKIDSGSSGIYTSLSKVEPALNKIVLFPNPATETLNILLNLKKAEGEIRIYDMMGKLIHEEKIISNNDNTIKIGIGNLVRGIYLLKYSDPNTGSFSSKFLKL